MTERLKAIRMIQFPAGHARCTVHVLVILIMGLGGCAPRPKPSLATDGRPHVTPGTAAAWTDIGRSVEERPIRAVTFSGSSPSPRVLIFAGIHGDEWQTAEIAERLIEELSGEKGAPPLGSVMIIPRLNPDGLYSRRRTNANGVDLNRNFPASNWAAGRRSARYYPGPSPASEPETRALMAIVEQWRPDRILAIHVIGGRRYCNNFDGPASELAEVMAARNGYPVRPDMGYPTPGSFGSWSGRDRGIPTVTLELPAESDIDGLWQTNREAILAFAR